MEPVVQGLQPPLFDLYLIDVASGLPLQRISDGTDETAYPFESVRNDPG